MVFKEFFLSLIDPGYIPTHALQLILSCSHYSLVSGILIYKLKAVQQTLQGIE